LPSTAQTQFGNLAFSKYQAAMFNQSSVVGSAILIGCSMLHITSQVSRTIIDIVDIPIKNSEKEESRKVRTGSQISE